MAIRHLALVLALCAGLPRPKSVNAAQNLGPLVRLLAWGVMNISPQG